LEWILIYLKHLDSKNEQPSRADVKEDYDLKGAVAKEKGSKSKKTNNKVKSILFICFYANNNLYYMRFLFKRD